MPAKNLVSNIVCIPEGADEKDQEEEEAALPVYVTTATLHEFLTFPSRSKVISLLAPRHFKQKALPLLWRKFHQNI